jgi:pyruvate/2-oxoglutarate dehydrogenase complex dihydrolipoamide acyltransferase (E2) component
MTTTQLLRFRLPDLGEGVAETEIVRWLVSEGDELAEDQPMVEVMTDKATVEIPAPAAGTVTQLCAGEGAVVQVGSVIIEIATSEAAAAAGVGSARAVTREQATANSSPSNATSAVPSSSKAAGGRVQATPLVRRVAAELGVDLATITGTGPGGRITESDVRGAAGATPAPAQDSGTDAPAGTRIVELRGMRRQIAAHLERAAAVPTVTVVEEAELTALDAARADTGLGHLAYLVPAVVAGLREVPQLNAILDGGRGELVVHEQIHMGIAVQTERGLVVPVLRDCAQLTPAQVEEQVAALAEKARTDSLTPDELRGGTFTVTSAGKLGGLFTTPLLNVPEVGILGLHRAEQRAVVRGGEVSVRTMANLSVTFDHRALDGLDASRFLLAVIAALESPQAI